VPAAIPPTGSSRGGRRVGIVDVAARAGVSRQTVSNVINARKEYYSQDTHDRVLAAMEDLRYQPDRAAQSLRSRRSMQIGYHMFGQQLESVNGFFLHFLQSLVKQAALDDYQLLVFTHHDDDPLAVFKELIARRSVDAFVLSESAVDDPRVHLLADSRIPFACMGRLAPALPQQWVDVDNAASPTSATAAGTTGRASGSRACNALSPNITCPCPQPMCTTAMTRACVRSSAGSCAASDRPAPWSAAATPWPPSW
jgi:hypothetical protein